MILPVCAYRIVQRNSIHLMEGADTKVHPYKIPSP